MMLSHGRPPTAIFAAFQHEKSAIYSCILVRMTFRVGTGAVPPYVQLLASVTIPRVRIVLYNRVFTVYAKSTSLRAPIGVCFVFDVVSYVSLNSYILLKQSFTTRQSSFSTFTPQCIDLAHCVLCSVGDVWCNKYGEDYRMRHEENHSSETVASL